MKRTNTNEYKKAFYPLLIEWIDFEGTENNSPQQKLKELYNEFDRCANFPYNLHKFPNTQERFKDYLQGLPIAIPFVSSEIIEIAESLHECKLSEKQENTIINNFFNHCAFHYLKLIDMSEEQLNKYL